MLTETVEENPAVFMRTMPLKVTTVPEAYYTREGKRGRWREFKYSGIERLADPKPAIERERADTMESVRLRLLWAVAAGGDEGTVARCAISVIRFVEGDGRHWSDRAIKGLHIRLCRAAGLPRLRFEAARNNLVRDLFIPL